MSEHECECLIINLILQTRDLDSTFFYGLLCRQDINIHVIFNFIAAATSALTLIVALNPKRQSFKRLTVYSRSPSPPVLRLAGEEGELKGSDLLRGVTHAAADISRFLFHALIGKRRRKSTGTRRPISGNVANLAPEFAYRWHLTGELSRSSNIHRVNLGGNHIPRLRIPSS